MSINWPVKKLGEVANIYGGGTPPTNQPEYFQGYINWFTPTELPVDNVGTISISNRKISEQAQQFTNMSNAGTVLLSSRATIGNVAILSTASGYNQGIKGIEPKDEIDNWYLGYWLKANKDKLLLKSFGTTFREISTSAVKDLDIPVPPLKSQKKIVERLDAIRKAQELNDLQITKTEELFESLVFKELEDLEIESQSLSKVCSFQYGYTQSAQNVGQYRFIRITDINEYGEIREDDEKFISDDIELLKPYILNKGDLLLARTGATYGKILHFSLDQPSVFASFLIRIIPDKSKVLPGYIWLFSRSRNYWNQAKRLVSGTGQPQFNANKIKEIKIKIPNLGAQQEIVGKLEAVQDYKKLLQKQKLLLKELFDSVLDKSMKGEMDN